MNVTLVSEQGQRTADNRDAMLHCCHHGVSLFLLVDGSSSQAHSGEFAQLLCSHVEQGFSALTAAQLGHKQLKQQLFVLLQSAQQEACRQYPAACVSYVLLVKVGLIALVCHLGDCLFGRVSRTKAIKWLTKPHCALAQLDIETLAQRPERNLLTRCFKAKRFTLPQWQVRAVKAQQSLILATDGFWADLNPQQQKDWISESPLGTKQTALNVNDDTSFILIQL